MILDRNEGGGGVARDDAFGVADESSDLAKSKISGLSNSDLCFDAVATDNGRQDNGRNGDGKDAHQANDDGEFDEGVSLFVFGHIIYHAVNLVSVEVWWVRSAQ